MAFSHFLTTCARRLPADVRRCQSSLRSITQSTHLHTISPLTTTRHPPTPQSLSSTLLSRASISSHSSGVHQTHPVNPPDTEPESPIENPRLGGEEEKQGSGMESDGFSTNVLELTCDSADGGTCVVHLVGTCHVSPESCREVEAVIRKIKPQVVFLELCETRKAILTRLDRKVRVPTMSEMIERWKKKQHPFGIAYSWFLAKVSDKLEVLPGSEFRVGYEEARKCGSKVVLGDRPVNVTLQRTWGKMPLWHKTKLLCSFFFTPFAFTRVASCKVSLIAFSSDMGTNLHRLSSADVEELIQEMGKQFPTLHETLVDERDQYMSSTLLRVASCHHSVVAVVGKAHLAGIKKYWLQPVDMDKLMEIP